MVYIDEAQDYFDQNIGVILSPARKYKVGMITAHLGQSACFAALASQSLISGQRAG